MSTITDTTVLCIGAGFEQLPAIKLSRHMGHRVVALDGSPHAPGFALADLGLVVDLRDVQSVIRIARDVNARCALPVPLGAVLTTVGAVNDTLGWRGISYRAAIACTDKMMMREMLSMTGLAQPAFQRVYSSQQARVAANVIGFPVVLKPTHGSGSRGVALVNSDYQLNLTLASLEGQGYFAAPGGLLVESELRGCEHGVDAVMIDGRCMLLSVRAKVISSPPYRVATQYIGPIQLSQELYITLQATIQAAAQALGLDGCMMHADVMIDDVQSQVSVIEISGRPSGFGLGLELLPACLGINPVEQTIRMMLGHTYSFEPLCLRVGALRGLFDKPGRLTAVGNLEAARSLNGVLSIRMPLALGETIPPLQSGADWWRAGSAMLIADDQPALEALWFRMCDLLALRVM